MIGRDFVFSWPLVAILAIVLTVWLCSGILPVNAHAEVNILNLNYIDRFIFYSSTNRLSNDADYN